MSTVQPSNKTKPQRGAPKKGGIPNEPRGALAQDQDYRIPLMTHDEFQIDNPDPDRVYRFVSTAHLDKGAGFDHRGWEPITKENSKGERLRSAFGHVSSGTDLRYGSLTVCFMPKERWLQKQAMLNRRKKLQEAAVNRLKNEHRRYRHDGEGMVTDFNLSVRKPQEAGQVDNF